MFRNMLLTVSILLIASPRLRPAGCRHPRRNGRNPRQPWHGLGDISPNQQAGQEPAVVDSVHGPLRPLGLGRIGTAAGEAQHDFLDKVLKETHESGQKLAFRVMCCSTYKGHPYHPEWLKEIGGKELSPTTRQWPVSHSRHGRSDRPGTPISTSSSGWASDTTVTPTSTTLTLVPSAGGASGT